MTAGSREVTAFYRHVDEHGCGNPDSPNSTGGTAHCPEAVRLHDAIPLDDPDYPIAYAGGTP